MYKNYVISFLGDTLGKAIVETPHTGTDLKQQIFIANCRENKLTLSISCFE